MSAMRRAVKGAVLGLLFGVAVGVTAGAGAYAASVEDPNRSKGRRLTLSMAEGMRGAAFAALVAMPIGALVAVIGPKRTR